MKVINLIFYYITQKQKIQQIITKFDTKYDETLHLTYFTSKDYNIIV
nr:MAG TPA: hypothetical protein [Caudoviricetes sp.]